MTKQIKGRQKQNKPKYDSESVGLVGRRLTCDQLSYFPFAWQTSPFSEKKNALSQVSYTEERRSVLSGRSQEHA